VGWIPEVERNAGVEAERELAVQKAQRDDVHVLGAEVARELLAERRPAIREVGGRQHGDREAATIHATVDLGDHHPAQR
jgi:hypothetical protein